MDQKFVEKISYKLEKVSLKCSDKIVKEKVRYLLGNLKNIDDWKIGRLKRLEVLNEVIKDIEKINKKLLEL